MTTFYRTVHFISPARMARCLPAPFTPVSFPFLGRNGSVDQGCGAAWVEHKGGPALNIPEGGRSHSKAWFLAYQSLVPPAIFCWLRLGDTDILTGILFGVGLFLVERC
jgi:hypothetical protein